MYKLLMLVTLLPSLALANAAEDLVAKLQGLESLRGGFEQTVLDQDGRVLPLLSDQDCQRLIETGVAKGGMQPKLEAAQLAAHQSPHAIVKIAPAAAPDCVLQGLRDGQGTRFFARTQTQTKGALQHG